MPSHYWAKFWIEILDDPKMGRLPDRLWRRAGECFLLAKEQNEGGYLPSLANMAWRLRLTEGELAADLEALAAEGIEIVQLKPDGRWFVRNSAKRQASASDAERMRRHRNRQRKDQYADERNGYSDDNGDEDVTDTVTTRNTETEAETEAETETDLPGADAPEIFPQTANPQSISNDKTDPGARPDASTGDYLGDVGKHCASGTSWTVPAAAGGRDSYADGPLRAFCGLVGMPLDSLTDKKRGQWVAGLRRVAEQWRIPAGTLADCIAALSESEFGFKAYSTPYQESFVSDVAILIGRALQGEPLIRTKEQANRSPPRGGKVKRREHEPCSDAERQQAWQQHGEQMLIWVQARRDEVPGINVTMLDGRLASDFGLGEQAAQALMEAFLVHEACRLEPVKAPD